jgi:hypothetical protein
MRRVCSVSISGKRSWTISIIIQSGRVMCSCQNIGDIPPRDIGWSRKLGIFRLCLSNRKKMRKSATEIGEPGDLTVSFRARYPTGRQHTRETAAIRTGRPCGQPPRSVGRPCGQAPRTVRRPARSRSNKQFWPSLPYAIIPISCQIWRKPVWQNLWRNTRKYVQKN